MQNKTKQSRDQQPEAVQRGIWDYDHASLNLDDPEVVKWYLARKIEYNDWGSIEYPLLKQYLPELEIDQDKKNLLARYIDWYEHTKQSTKRVSSRAR